MYYCRKIPSPFLNQTDQKIPNTLPIETRERKRSLPLRQNPFSPLTLLFLFDLFSPQKKDG